MNVLITGGSRGIGAAIARKLAGAGHDVAISYRSEAARAEEVVAACQALGVRCFAFQADVSREEDCSRLVQEVRTALGPIGILVNNAGMTRDGLAMRMSLQQFSSVIDANLTGTFLMCKLVLPDMVKARQGRIINLTSVAGLYGNPGQVNYAASKAGVVGLTLALAKEMGSRNITVNAVAPGFIDTDMTRALPEAAHEAALKAISLGRLGQPEDIAAAVAFLASPDASYITGQVLEISGGLSL
jgi:3-oxoacyl-[acyl-carrier protein] reductase